MKVAYCTGFWCTNIGNGFFSMGVEYALEKVLGEENVTVVSDLQTYTTGYGKRLYVDRNQLEYISCLDVDYVVLAGPVISKYFLSLWKDILIKLRERGIGYILLSMGTMKMNEAAYRDICEFFTECPPYALSSRDETVYREFGKYAKHAYNGICFSFFVPDVYAPCGMSGLAPYAVFNFDKIQEPKVWIGSDVNGEAVQRFEFDGEMFHVAYPRMLTAFSAKTDRFTDALIYASSMLPAPRREDVVGKYRIVRTDHRFHPHYRGKIYRRKNSYVADIPYGYLNLYANARFTLSDRVHACAVTLAFGGSAMLYSKTNRAGLLERVGAVDICRTLVKLDMDKLEREKRMELEWLQSISDKRDTE